jgi:hypothetical protein
VYVCQIDQPKVLNKIYEFYEESLKNREEWIGKGIDFTLKENEFGLLFMKRKQQVEIPR